MTLTLLFIDVTAVTIVSFSDYYQYLSQVHVLFYDELLAICLVILLFWLIVFLHLWHVICFVNCSLSVMNDVSRLRSEQCFGYSYLHNAYCVYVMREHCFSHFATHI